MRVSFQRLAPAVVSKSEDERKGRIVEREGGGLRHRPRHVGDAVVNDTVDDIGWIGMRCRVGGLEAATLSDCDIPHDGTRLHGSDHVAGHQLRSRRTRKKDGADYKICPADEVSNGSPGREDRGDGISKL